MTMKLFPKPPNNDTLARFSNVLEGFTQHMYVFCERTLNELSLNIYFYYLIPYQSHKIWDDNEIIP